MSTVTPTLDNGKRSRLTGVVSAFKDPTTIIAIVVVTIPLAVMVLYPVVNVLVQPAIEHWQAFFSRTRYLRTLRNSLVMAALSTVSATFVGFCFAYALSRPNFPGKTFFRVTSILPLISPPFVAGLALILLLGRRGIITHGLLGVDVSMYGWHGLWLAQTMAYYPIAAMTLSGVLKSLNPTLEYAAQDLGQSRWGIFKTVVLPMTIPGIAGAALLVSMLSLSDFGNPMVIGGPFRVMAVEAYVQVVGMQNLGMAAAISVVLLVPSLLFFLIQRYWVGRRQYTSVSGKGGGLDPIELPTAVKWALFAFLSFVSLFVVAIFVVIVWGAFARTWGFDWSLTLDNFEFTFLARLGHIWNSVRFSLAAGFGTAVFAVIAAYVLLRKRFVGMKAFDFLVVLPAALPGTLVGIAYIFAFNRPPLVLTGTGLIIILSMAIRNVPVGYRTALAGLQQIDISIEESAADGGANTFQILKDITLPLLKTAFTVTLVYTFVRSMNTVSAVVFLVAAGTNVATTSILGLSEHGYWGEAAAMATILIAITSSVVIAFRVLGGKRLFEL